MIQKRHINRGGDQLTKSKKKFEETFLNTLHNYNEKLKKNIITKGKTNKRKNTINNHFKPMVCK